MNSPKLTPLRFLRVAASEYLAAYELASKSDSALSETQRVHLANQALLNAQRAQHARKPAAVVDISAHRKFDGSALTLMCHEPALAHPRIGA